jgi:DUTP diphosphatase superfamily|nr:MAG TPA: dUTPase [Caudoviricetes sp.]
MEIKKPENFLDMLELQKYLDNKICSFRSRGIKDIKKSLIAECIEFDEETKDSHKTWKKLNYNKEKELEELTDIWFFAAQLVNYSYENRDITTLEKKELLKFFEDDNSAYSGDIGILDVIFDVRSPVMDYDYLKFLILDLMVITNKYGYTKNDILDIYWKKFNKNLERIGKEWN